VYIIRTTTTFMPDEANEIDEEDEEEEGGTI
jgi:hypothetical protein